MEEREFFAQLDFLQQKKAQEEDVSLLYQPLLEFIDNQFPLYTISQASLKKLSWLPREKANEAAEEIAQDVLLQVYRSLHTLRARELTGLKAWLLTILKHTVYKWLKDHNNEKKSEMPVEELSLQSSEQTNKGDLTDWLKEVLHSNSLNLPKQQWQCIYLYYVEQVPYKKIATQLQIEENHARLLSYRGLSSIRERFQQKKKE